MYFNSIFNILIWISTVRAALSCESQPELTWLEWQLSERDHSSSVKWPWGVMPPCWTTVAPLCLLCPEQQQASLGWRDCTASFFISCLRFSSLCCSYSRLGGGGANASSHGGHCSPGALSEAFLLMSYSGLSSMEWCTFTEKRHTKIIINYFCLITNNVVCPAVCR